VEKSKGQSNQDEFQREERRALLSLGLLAIIVSILINATTLNLPRIFITLLYGLASLWVLYALSMMVYFSDDLFSLKTRLRFKQIGLRLLFIWPLEFLIGISIFAAAKWISPIFTQPIVLGFSVFLPFLLVNLLLTPRIRKATSKTD
jgi:hypothetical protein